MTWYVLGYLKRLYAPTISDHGLTGYRKVRARAPLKKSSHRRSASDSQDISLPQGTARKYSSRPEARPLR
jgi:hypothetical protein